MSVVGVKGKKMTILTPSTPKQNSSKDMGNTSHRADPTQSFDQIKTESLKHPRPTGVNNSQQYGGEKVGFACAKS